MKSSRPLSWERSSFSASLWYGRDARRRAERLSEPRDPDGRRYFPAGSPISSGGSPPRARAAIGPAGRGGEQGRRIGQRRHRIRREIARGRLHPDDLRGGNLVIKPFLEHSLAFDPLVDLVPVFNFAEAPHILVVPTSLP